MGPILELVVVEGVMERLFLWSLRRQFTEDMKLEQLRTYQNLLAQARQPLLHHKPILRPLMMLLASCAGAGESLHVTCPITHTHTYTDLLFRSGRERRCCGGGARGPAPSAVRRSRQGHVSAGTVLPHQ